MVERSKILWAVNVTLLRENHRNLIEKNLARRQFGRETRRNNGNMKLDLMETDDAWIELTQNNIH